ncbi:MAG: hypothetical protein HRT86_14390 [Ilumatobacteraceae bacterium]|nr:hypothetical protein [Ilumatobacteraceae bacterium]
MDVVLLEFPEQNPSSGSARALLSLVDAGVIQLYDIVAIRRTVPPTVRPLSS